MLNKLESHDSEDKEIQAYQQSEAAEYSNVNWSKFWHQALRLNKMGAA